ncbi:Ig-like domain-containing protein [Novosphingobium guangzhouense]|uniref:BapA prefix-like domain-containing protein n=1 Tax=Novosphingobium guangzhouense TaxID=1850347 RepID=A0A2K2G6S3_9SPHN|nr:Ig-like domain-containing protein [Novosphingobium guangzhouense]PNU06722.1 hypothetical protein A8V01_00585 [Novosphingobium guangzhouense]
MTVEAKIASDMSAVHSAPVQIVQNSVSVTPGSSVALNVQPEAVSGYAREGSDLVVHLKTGETLRVSNFYADPSKLSHLMLVEEDHLVAVDVAQVSGGALATPAYAPIDAMAGFTTPAAASAAGAAAGAAGGGLGMGVIAPLAVLGGGGLVAAAASGGGGDSDDTPSDNTPPAAPTDLTVSAAGDRLTGRAEAGATVLIDTDGNGIANYTVTAAADGLFTVILNPALVNAQTISVTARDAAGNNGPAATVTAPDYTAPQPATEISVAEDGSSISGTGEPGATVLIDVDQDGEADYTTTIGTNGRFFLRFAVRITNGEPIDVTIIDDADNESTIVTVQAPDHTPPPATAPTIDATNGTIIEGTAASGVAVVITGADGVIIGQAAIEQDGSWSFTPSSPLANGVIITANAINDEGQAGPAATVTVDAVAPDAPVISQSNGTQISGMAEAGAVIILTDGNGNPIGQTTANANGIWSFTPGNSLQNGTVINAIARDAAGNTSGQVSTTVDSIAPPAPVLTPPNAVTVAGTAEANATILISDGNGNPIGQAIADANGNWTFNASPPLANGTIVRVVAMDGAGNLGPFAGATVDAIAPATPNVAPSQGTVISGTAEAGATILLTDGNGNPLGQTTVNGDGTWNFTPLNPLANGTTVNAVARDAAANVSPIRTIITDSVAPATPTISPSNGTEVSGTAESGSTITLVDGNGNFVGQAVADADGGWSFMPPTPLPNGSVVNATAQDAAGNVSGPASTTVDTVSPDEPVINPTGGAQVTGTAEAGTLLLLVDGDGNAIGQTIVDANGAWTFTPDAPLPDGTVVNATAQDAAGNISSQASATVDASSPADPTIDPTNGSVVTGTAEPNSTVVLMDGTGSSFASFSPMGRNGATSTFAATTIVPDYGLPLGQVTTDGQGNWTFTPVVPLPDGTVVIAVSVDAAGNVSGPVDTIVDGIAPDAPTIDPTTGLLLQGLADPGVTIRLSDGQGNPIGETTADDDGAWSFIPAISLPNDTVVIAVAVDEAGNISLPASTAVDTVAPPAPVVAASNGNVITGNGEPGTIIMISDALGVPLGEATVDANGHWTFTPASPLPDSTIVEAVAVDAAGNTSTMAFITIDAIAPDSPILSLVSEGEVLMVAAEPGSVVRIVVNGDAANPFLVNIDSNGSGSLSLLAPLIGSETVTAITIDAAGNQSGPTVFVVPDIVPPTIIVVEAEDGFVNAAEAANGVQVDIAIRPTMQEGQTITVVLDGANGYQATESHVLSAADLLSQSLIMTVAPSGNFPDGAAQITARIDGGAASIPVEFLVDKTPPATPLLSLVANALTISAEPNSELTIIANIGGLETETVVTVNNSGLASLNLLTDLGVRLDWTQLLETQISVVSADAAGNTSSVATVALAPTVETPVTIGNLGLDVSLNPLSPRFGVSGNTEPNSSVVVQVTTPALNVELLPLIADGSGNFSLNLLSPTILNQLGLSITDVLNLGSEISLGLVATDGQGNESATYGLSLSPNGLSLAIGQIDVNGTLSDDIMSGATGAEHINGNSGNDFIQNVSVGDHVLAGLGNDTIQVTAPNFSTVDGGSGFDTVLLGNGINLDYGANGVGTFANIERVDLGTGGSGSVLTLTSAEVSAITDAGNTLQITGDSNDVLHITGAVNTGSSQTLEGIAYNVYAFGINTVLVEENTVQVIV